MHTPPSSHRLLRIAATAALLLTTTATAASASTSGAEGAAVITTIAGTGTSGFSGDLGPAIDAELSQPSSVVEGPDGTLFVSDFENNRIRAIDVDGTIRTIAGVGTRGGSGDSGPATDAELFLPSDIAVDTEGNLFVADYFNHRVRRIGTDGIITTVAGNGEAVFGGDGIAATASSLNRPAGVDVAADGTIYIADQENHRIRAVAPDGTITTVAGIGTAGYSGDGGAATQAELAAPSDVEIGPDGALYVTDFDNHVIRRIGTDGVITSIEAGLSDPAGLDVAPDGTIYVADYGNQLVRSIASDGSVTTVAGTEEEGYSGDGGAATDAQLFDPTDVEVLADGSVLVADFSNHRIRQIARPIAPAGPVAEPAPTTPTTAPAPAASPEPTPATNPTPAPCQRRLVGSFAGAGGDDGRVARLYMAVFTRQPDAGGHRFWVDELAAGRSFRSIARFFVTSDEFVQRYQTLTDDEFVELLYGTVMCRTPDAGGRAFWLDQLRSGISRGEMALQFSESPEFKQITGTR